jgi:hypothetical protein
VKLPVRAAILIGTLSSAVFGQTQGAQLIESLLKDAGVVRGTSVRGAEVVSTGSREIQLRWNRPVGRAATATEPAPSVISQKTWSADVAQQRSPELSETQIVVAAVDSSGALRSWNLIADPRILRVEAPGPNGALTGQVVELESADFNVAIPNDAAVRQLKLFKPVWDGKQFQLRQIAVCDVP